jgi:tetratricopeptide (TPR) repeat protein
MERDAGSWKGPYLLGQALFGLNRVDEAERHVREAVLRKPDAAGAYALLADIHLHNSNYPAVLQDLDAYLKLQPDGPARERARHLREDAERMMANPKPQSGKYEFLPPRFAY